MDSRRYRKSQNFYEEAGQFFVSAHVLSQLKRYAMIMAVMMPRETWTDERLDDLSKKVDDGFARLDGDIRELRAEVKAQGDSLRGEIKSQGETLRAEIKTQGETLRGEMNDLRSEMNARFDATLGSTNERFESINARFESINARFDALNRNLLAVAAAIIAAVIGSNAF
jgi:chromosome segregation ATPase